MVAENCKIKLPRTSYHLADFCPKGNREGLPGVTMYLKSGDDNGGVALVCKGHQEGSNPLGGVQAMLPGGSSLEEMMTMRQDRAGPTLHQEDLFVPCQAWLRRGYRDTCRAGPKGSFVV